MVAEGRGLPTVAQVAAAADVSRRTAYRYFPTPEQLATEAVLETLAPQLDAGPDPARTDDVPTRVTTTVRRMQEAAVANEQLLRTMIRLTIDRRSDAGDERPSARGSRRVRWLSEAIEPLRPRVGRAAWERLLSALCLCVGAEAFIALRDARGLASDEAIEVCVWASDALLQAAVRQHTAPVPLAKRRRPPTRG
jgi:AcrR family transcriptional regulator